MSLAHDSPWSTLQPHSCPSSGIMVASKQPPASTSRPKRSRNPTWTHAGAVGAHSLLASSFLPSEKTRACCLPEWKKTTTPKDPPSLPPTLMGWCTVLMTIPTVYDSLVAEKAINTDQKLAFGQLDENQNKRTVFARNPRVVRFTQSSHVREMRCDEVRRLDRIVVLGFLWLCSCSVGLQRSKFLLPEVPAQRVVPVVLSQQSFRALDPIPEPCFGFKDWWFPSWFTLREFERLRGGGGGGIFRETSFLQRLGVVQRAECLLRLGEAICPFSDPRKPSTWTRTWPQTTPTTSRSPRTLRTSSTRPGGRKREVRRKRFEAF